MSAKRLIGIVAGVAAVISLFLPALQFGFGSVSLWDTTRTGGGGNAIIILVMGLAVVLCGLIDRLDYLQAASTGIFAVALSDFIEFIRSESLEFIGIGMILLLLAGLVGIAAREIRLQADKPAGTGS